MGPQTVKAPAFYARSGSIGSDLMAVLHPPYTAWHMSYAALGAALAPHLDALRLIGTLTAFFLGTGIAAHALDELRGRPLRTLLPAWMLGALSAAGLAGAWSVTWLGATFISPWVWAWAAAGTALAVGYAVEVPGWLHTTAGFAAAWGAFPVLVGYWAQTESVTIGAVIVAVAAALVSAAQRTLSTPARYLRRKVDWSELRATRSGETEVWSEDRVLATWERPLRLLAWGMVVLAAGMVFLKL